MAWKKLAIPLNIAEKKEAIEAQMPDRHDITLPMLASCVDLFHGATWNSPVPPVNCLLVKINQYAILAVDGISFSVRTVVQDTSDTTSVLSLSRKSPPPRYEDIVFDRDGTLSPPIKTKQDTIEDVSGKETVGAKHYVRSDDTLLSLAFKYNVDLHTLRTFNRLYHDNDLHARLYIIIPGYTGPSLSASRSPEDERKSIVKRFQILTKCIDPREAHYYVALHHYHLDRALEQYASDQRWEATHPFRRAKYNVRGIRAVVELAYCKPDCVI
ncbi:hypothetical protein BZG36_03592 [Bifiguratus adelaidae]|uniref:LysM domain-containing protein n=1 Tax=Bifiguratus adelaidae TaxID=1938954 RepID=A0A261XYJ6_9FUNG|nr:hypothetical protein BZG36_03592 [Bifiguratus adelaidae]